MKLWGKKENTSRAGRDESNFSQILAHVKWIMMVVNGVTHAFDHYKLFLMPAGIKWHVEHSDSGSRHRLRLSVCGEVINAVLRAHADTGNQPKAEYCQCLLLSLEYELILPYCILSSLCVSVWWGTSSQVQTSRGSLPAVVKHVSVMYRDKQNGVCCWAKVGRGEATAMGYAWPSRNFCPAWLLLRPVL